MISFSTTFSKQLPYRTTVPGKIFLPIVNHKNTKNIKCLKLTKKILEQRHCRSSSVFTVNFEHTSHLFLVFLLLVIIVA